MVGRPRGSFWKQGRKLKGGREGGIVGTQGSEAGRKGWEARRQD